LVALPFLNKRLLGTLTLGARDHARVAIPWSATLPNGGFTKGTPALRVMPDCRSISVETNLAHPNSVLSYYQRLISLRLSSDVSAVIKYGTFREYVTNKHLYVYTRSYKGTTIIVVCNMHNAQVPFNVPDRIAFNSANVLIANYDMPPHLGTVTLRPYECIVYRLQ
jgi:oligo-1,6-glucosidase